MYQLGLAMLASLPLLLTPGGRKLFAKSLHHEACSMKCLTIELPSL